MEQLEDRTLFDASGAYDPVVVLDHGANPFEAISQQLAQQPDGFNKANAQSFVQQGDYNSGEVVFVDSAVIDYEDVVRSLSVQGIEAHVLYSDRGGLEQVAETLSDRSDISRIHLISHGNRAELLLGDATIQSDDLASEYADELKVIGQALAVDGDILIYGCNLAGNVEGEQFVDLFSRMTSADVAASEDVTGGESGDWDFEYQAGSVRATGQVVNQISSVVQGPLLVEAVATTDSNGDTEAFLRGNFVEIGLRDQGTFGTEQLPPAGFHPRTNNGIGLGIVANPQADGFATFDGDFVAPSSPVESFSIEVFGEFGPSLFNNTNSDIEQNSGSLGTPFTTTLYGENAASVVWTGTSHGFLEVERTYTVFEDGLYVLIETTITNVLPIDVPDVYFAHNADPDNDVSIGAGLETNNEIVSQPDATTNLAHVSATQTDNDGSYIGLVAEDARARVAHGGFDNTDASDIYNGVGLNSAVGDTTFADEAISLGFYFDTIAAGESVSFDYIYVFDETAITEAFDLIHSPAVDLDADDSSTATPIDYNRIVPVEDGGAPVADADIAITDPDSPFLVQSTITLTNPMAGDLLTAPTSDPGWPGGISVSPASTSSNIILEGNASLADYESALRLVEFSNPDLLADLTDRVVEIQVQDFDGHVSDVATTTFEFADIRASKVQTGTPVRNATNPDFWDVQYQIVVENNGAVTLDGIDLFEDLDDPGNFGAAFVSASTLAVVDLSFAGTGTAPTVNTGWDGQANTNILSDDGSLDPGDSFTIDFTVTLDVNAAAALPLTNQATVSVDDPLDPANENFIVDVSDSGVDPVSSNDGEVGAVAGSEDDPTPLIIRDAAVTKEYAGHAAAASGDDGHFDVTYTFTVENTGTEPITTLSLQDNLAGQFGMALVGILDVTVTNIDATSAPVENAAYDGSSGSDLLIGSTADRLDPGQSFEVTLVIELDPDAIGAIFSTTGALENSAVLNAVDRFGIVSDISDDPTVTTDFDTEGDGEGDDPTAIFIADLAVQKEIVGSAPSLTGPIGNFEVVYDITITNTGNDTITNLMVEEDLAAHFGSAFQGLVLQGGAPATIVASTALNAPEIDAAYTGIAGGSQLIDNSGANVNELARGESVTIRVIVELDPDATGANRGSDGSLSNQVLVTGTGTSGVIQELSDDPDDGSNVDSTGDNDPDDPTLLYISGLDLTKQISGTPTRQADGTWNVDFELTYTNTGSSPLTSLSWIDDLSSPSYLGTAWSSTLNVSLDTSAVVGGTAPGLNPAWQTDPTQQILDGTGTLLSGESVTLTFTANVDPDASGTSGVLINQATGRANGTTSSVEDASDDPTVSANVDPDGNQNPDDPTVLSIADIAAVKVISDLAEVAGRTGLFDVEYTIVIENTGTVDLQNLQLTETLGGVAGHFGSGFVGVITDPAFGLSTLSPGASLPTLAAWDGAANDDIFDGVSGVLLPGDSLEVTFAVRVDTVAGDSNLSDGNFENQVAVTAISPDGIPATDLSDDGTNPNTNNGDGSGDTPTGLTVPQIRLSKNYGSFAVSPDGSYTVPVTITLTNTGLSSLSGIDLDEDIAAQFGNGLLGVQNASVQSSGPFGGVLPGFNPAWESDTSVPVFTTAANLLLAGESLTFTFDAIVDPDAVDGLSQALINQATVSAVGIDNDGIAVTVNDQSGNISTTSAADNDRPTVLVIPEIVSTKRITNQVSATSGTPGNLDVTYSFTLTNSGTVRLVNPTIVDDWVGQLGGAFVTIVDADLSDDVTVPGGSGIGGNASYTGTASENLFNGTGQLLPGETVEVLVTVELDPDSPTAILNNGQLENQATAQATYDPRPLASGDEITVTDLSDDPADLTDVDIESDGDADDVTALRLTRLDVTKAVSGFAPADSGTDGNYDVTYLFVIVNPGTDTLSTVSLNDDLVSQFGGAFVQVVDVVVANIDATSAPAVNAGYTGAAGSDLLNGAATDEVRSGESFMVELVVELNPDSPTATLNGLGQLENSARVSAIGSTSIIASDISDDPADLTNVDPNLDGSPDDPTTFSVGDLSVTKTAATPVPAVSGTPGNWDVAYTFTVENIGNEALNNLSLTDDWATQLGGAFVRVVDINLSDDVFGSPTVSGIGGYAGGPTQNMFAVGSTLGIGETVTVTVLVEVDPDAATANLINGSLQNSATAVGLSSRGAVSDQSDDPTVATNVDPDGDNNPDDPTSIRFSSLDVTKRVAGTAIAASGVTGNFDVTFAFAVTNTGSDTLSNLSLTDNLVSQFGGALVDVINVAVSNVNATSVPTANASYDGSPLSDMLIGSASDALAPGESFLVTLEVEIDPDSSIGQFGPGGELINTATVAADDSFGGSIFDLSDDPTNAADVDLTGDGNPDDPTSFTLAAINLLKTAAAPVPATSGVAGNLDIAYTFVVENTGNEVLANVALIDDWAARFGGAFVGIVDSDLSDDVAGSVTLVGSGNYSGGATENVFAAGSSLAIGESATLTIVVEVDPDSPSAAIVNGGLENFATINATGSTVSVTDVSDDPADASNVDPDGDNNPDDPTFVSWASVDVTKEVTSVDIASSATTGNYDVTWVFTVTNTGTETLTGLSLTDDLLGQFGGALVGIGGVSINNVDATAAPAINSGYTGSAGSDLLLGSPADVLESGQSFEVTLVAEIDPDNASGIFDANSRLVNIAIVSAEGEFAGTVTDLSDDPLNLANVDGNGDNNPDDPTSLAIGSLNVLKSVGQPVAASSGVSSNFDVTYTFEIENTGNDALTNLLLLDDWAFQLGGAFVGIVDADLSDDVTGSATVTGNSSYAGGATENLFGAGSVLQVGETVTVQVTVEVNPASSTALFVNGALANSATVFGESTLGTVVDISDDPAIGTDVDLNGDNNPDDPTLLSFPSLSVLKEVTSTTIASSGAAGHFDVEYTFTVLNSGIPVISNLSLLDDLVGQLGGAFVDVVSVDVVNVDASSAPAANPNYDGSATSDILSGSANDAIGELQSFTVVLVVEVDPDSPTANYNGSGLLENTASIEGISEFGATVSDQSDDPGNLADVDINGDGEPDDPTAFSIGSLRLLKTASTPVVATSGTRGNYDVTYAFTIENTGNEQITGLTLFDDWSSQLGGAFVQIVDGNLSDDITGSATVIGNPVYGGGAAENLFSPGSVLNVGESVTISVTVEIDPDNATAILVNGAVANSATATGVTASGPVSDLSDDPAISSDVQLDGDNSPDDPTLVGVAALNVDKEIVATDFASSGASGNFDVSYVLTVTNTGSETLSELSLADDLVSQFGGAFAQVVNVSVRNVNATAAPVANAGFTGTAGSDMLSGSVSDRLEPGQSFEVLLVVEVDPDSSTGIFNASGELENIATASATGERGSNATDLSDDPGNGADVDLNGDNNPDDATPFSVGALNVTKAAGLPTLSSSGTRGNYDLTYTFTVENTGNQAISNLVLTDDWAGELGGAFVGIVDADLSDDVVPGTTIVGNPAYGGLASENLFVAGGSLGIGESVTVMVTVELDPDSSTGILVDGGLQNSATADGMTASGLVSDVSDDPANLSNVDVNGDGNPDDPTTVRIALIDVLKEVTGSEFAASGTPGNYDVTYEFTVRNEGAESLTNLQLRDNLVGQFDGAFVDVVSVGVINIDATVAPVANAGYTGAALSDLLVGSTGDLLESGQSYQVILVVEIDPDHPGANLNGSGQLVNSARGAGDGVVEGFASDRSDDPTVATNLDLNGDRNPDDPTAFTIGALSVEKVAGTPAPAISGIPGNYDVTYTFSVINTGNEELTGLSLADDWAARFGGAFVRIVDTNLSDDVSGSVLANGNSSYSGGATENLFAAGSTLGIGETATIEVVVEIDPDDPAAALVGGGFFNRASGSGISTQGIVTDESDDPGSDLNVDPNADNDPDDPTFVSVASLDVQKTVVAAVDAVSGVAGNFDVTYEFTIYNPGSEPLSNLRLTDDLARQFGDAFVRVVNVAVSNVDATSVPAVNSFYNGLVGSSLLSGSGADSVESGQSFVVRLTVEVDPDSANGTFNSNDELENSALATGFGIRGNVATDVSDDPSDLTNIDPDANGNPDDPTTLAIGDLEVIKSAGTPVPASGFTGASGIAGNFVVPYIITINNTGNDTVFDLAVEEDLASQLAGGFVSVVGSPAISFTNLSGNTIANGVSFDGSSSIELLDAATSQLGVGDSITIVVNVEIDPDSATANLVNGEFLNSAVASGSDGSGRSVSDLSDDPSNATGDNDPTAVSIAALDVQKQVINTTDAVSGTTGNYDVTYEFVVSNTGSDTLSNLRLTDELARQFGGAFVRVVNVAVTNIDATSVPAANSFYNGLVGSSLLVGSGADALESGQSFVVRLTVEVDPDSATGLFNAASELENSALATGFGIRGDVATDVSDDPTDISDVDPDANGNPDDPTTLAIGDLEVIKTAGTPVPASGSTGASGIAGNFVVPYIITINNTGNDTVFDLAVEEDLASQLAGGFVSVVGSPAISVTNFSGNTLASSTFFNGSSSIELLDASTSQLGVGDSVTIVVNVEVDPDNATANLVNGEFLNSAIASGVDGSGRTVSDISDDPADGAGFDDPTSIGIADLFVTKEVVAVVDAASGTTGNFDVTYSLVVRNTGSETLSNLSLTDDLAGQFGGAFVSVLDVDVTNIDATGLPAANSIYDGTAASDILNGTATDELASGQSFMVTLVVELDPDNPAANFNPANALENTATVGADGTLGRVESDSDNPGNSADVDRDGDGHPDDPTRLRIGDIEVIKSVGTATPSNRVLGASGVVGNVVVPYTISLLNTGNDELLNLSLVEDIASQFGGAFVNVVGTPTVSVVNNSGLAIVDLNGAGYDGVSIVEVLDSATSQLGVGDSATIAINVEIDPDNPTANLVDGQLFNSARATGTGRNQPVISDVSDDPTNPFSNDDPTAYSVPSISLTKSVDSTVPSSGAVGNFDVTFSFVIANTGTETLSSLSLVDDLQTRFGSAFVQVVDVDVVNIDAASAPAVNDSYSGAGGSDILLGAASDRLESGQSFRVTLVVELDPDAAAANTDSSGSFENFAFASATGETAAANTRSDDPNVTTDLDRDADGYPDDVTIFAVPGIALTKSIASVDDASSGRLDNLDVTYTFTLTNVGSLPLDNLQITDDWIGNLGGAFVRIVDSNLADGNTTSPAGSGIGGNGSYFGGTAENLLGGTGTLNSGESVTVVVVVELDPDSPTAIRTSLGGITNFALGSGDTQDGETISDISDDPLNGADIDVDGDNDPDDQTTLFLKNLTIQKDDGGIVAQPGDEVTWTINYGNNGATRATGVVITETLSAGTQFNAAGSDPRWIETSPGSGVYELALGTLSAGSSGSVEFSVTVDSVLPSGFTQLVNRATIADDNTNGPDATTTDNVDVDITPVDAAPNYTIIKSNDVDSVAPGDIVTYTIVLTNTGNQNGTGVVVRDRFPTDILTNVEAGNGGFVNGGAGVVTWNIGNLDAGESVVLTVTAEIQFAVVAGANELVNEVEVTDDGINGEDPNPVDNIAIDTDVIDAFPGYELVKSDLTSAVTSGDTVTYFLTVRNVGNQAGSNVVITDSFPTDLLTVTSVSGGGTIDNVNGTVTWTLPTLSAGNAIQLAVTAEVVDAFEHGDTSIVNVGAVTDDMANGQDPTPENNSDSDINLILAAPDYQLTKSDGVSHAVSGDNLTYTIEVRNVGDQEGRDVTIVDEFPIDVLTDIVVSHNGVIDLATGRVTWNLPRLAAGETILLTMDATVRDSLPVGTVSFTNFATVTDNGANGSDPTDDNGDYDTNFVGVGQSPDYEVTKEDGVSAVTPGQSLEYNVRIRNVGSGEGTNVVVVDQYDPVIFQNVVASNGGIVDPVQGTITWTIPRLESGESLTYTISGNVAASVGSGSSLLINEVRVSDDGINGLDPTSQNNVGIDVDIVNSGPDYSLTKENGVDSVRPGETIVYTLTVDNVGSQEGTNVVVSDQFPFELFTNVVASNGGVVNEAAGTVTWNIASLGAGQSRSFTVEATVLDAVPAGFDFVTNIASVTDDLANGIDPTPFNNSAIDSDSLVAAPDHRITKDDGLTGVVLGQVITYDIVVEHTGNQEATGVIVVDTFPTEILVNVSASNGGIVDVVNGTVTWDLGSTDPGDIINLSVTGEISEDIDLGVDQITNTVVVRDDRTNGLPADPSDDSDTDTNAIQTRATYIVTKDDGRLSAAPGEFVTYAISITNDGGRPGADLVVTDNLPVLFESAVADNGGIVDLANGTVTWTIASLDVGDTVILSVTGQLVPQVSAGVEEFENTVSLVDRDNVTAEAVDRNFLDAFPDLEITIDDGGDVAIEGETLVYRITVTNVGNQDATRVIVTETLPFGTAFDPFESSVGWIRNGDRVLDFNIGDLAVGESREIQFALSVVDAELAGQTISNTASVSDDGRGGPDADITNNADSVTTEVRILVTNVSKRRFLSTTDSGVYEQLRPIQQEDPVTLPPLAATASAADYLRMDEAEELIKAPLNVKAMINRMMKAERATGDGEVADRGFDRIDSAHDDDEDSLATGGSPTDVFVESLDEQVNASIVADRVARWGSWFRSLTGK